jgi:hypothetical protein
MVAADDQVGSTFANNFYCAWSNFNANNGRIEFNRSTNGGTTLSAALALNNHWGQGANVQTGSTGQSLRPDMYLIDIFDGQVSSRQKLLIQR